MPRMKELAGAGFALAWTAFAGAALAEPPGLLGEALRVSASNDGYRLVGEVKAEDLDDAEETTLTLKADPGKTYRLYGVCDGDCTELSISVRDARGDLVDNTSGQDTDTPVLEIEDFSGDTLSVEVFMMNCSEDPCAFAISLAEDPDAPKTTKRTITLDELIASGSSSRRQSEPAAGSDEQLVASLKARPLDIHVLVGEIGVGRLGKGEAYRYFYDADPDAIYHAFAVCDCYNLDLVARDDDDKPLDSDTDSDSRPIVEVASDNWPEARRRGRQRLIIEVKMTDCGRDKCSFAVGLYKSK